MGKEWATLGKEWVTMGKEWASQQRTGNRLANSRPDQSLTYLQNISNQILHYK